MTLKTNLLSNLKRLEELDLRGNSLTTVHPDMISSPQSLKTVLLLSNLTVSINLLILNIIFI